MLQLCTTVKKKKSCFSFILISVSGAHHLEIGKVLWQGWNRGILGGLGAHSWTERVAESLAAVN